MEVNEKENSKEKNSSIENNDSYLLEEKQKFYNEVEVSPDVKEVIDHAFSEIHQIERNNMPDDVSTNENVNIVNEIQKNEEDIIDSIERDNQNKVNELKKNYKKKIKEIDEKTANYNIKYQKLENITLEYEERNKRLLDARKEFEEKMREYEQKTQELGDLKEEFENRNLSLQEAREQFTLLTKQVEEKKSDLEKREKKNEKLRQSLEKTRLDLEKSKIEFEKNKLELEIARTEAVEKDKSSNINEPIQRLKKDVTDKELSKENKGPIGKKELLENILHNLSIEGNFQSCFLIDNKGMLISEFSQIELDKMAVGAMFSLITTSALRTVDSLQLQELKYFKLASIKGEFMIKNITLNNYPRNFILVSYYEKSDTPYPKFAQKVDKNIIKKILKDIKRDFYELSDENKISWAFDNLTEKVRFLQEKYKIPEGDIENVRRNNLNRTAIEIRNLFETQNELIFNKAKEE